MRAVIQRIKEGSVTVDDREVARSGTGLLVLLGVNRGDTETDVQYMADTVSRLRIFEDAEGKMNRSLIEIGGEMLVVSQFTLYGDCRKGRRPSFTEAAPPDLAESLYERFVSFVKEKGLRVGTGRFGAAMAVSLVNDGPVTLILESKS
jgi:D-tyrosyl-tRNA(Tyr) deacylase